MTMTLEEAKRRVDVPWLWDYFGLPGKPSKSCCAPHRPDKNPSFSVFDEGRRFKDHATGEGGDAIDFLQLVKGVSNAEACRQFLSLADGAHVSKETKTRPAEKPKAGPTRDNDVTLNLRSGSEAEFEALAELRGIGAEGLRLAEQRGFLLFGDKKEGPFWSLVDLKGNFRQDRMLSGEPVSLRSGGSAKSRTIGSLVRPLGQQLVRDCPCILFVEGGPDFLAAHHLIGQASDPESYAAVGILGAGQNLTDENWSAYEGKLVRIFPHMDEPGIKAGARWEAKLKEHGAKVDVFDFAGLKTDRGEPVKDLNDFLQVSVDFGVEDGDVRSPLPF